jgi:hypothetical protein
VNRSLKLQWMLPVFVLLCLASTLPQPVYAETTGTAIYLPVVARQVDDCALAREEQALSEIIRTAPQQGRTALTCNPILRRVAQAQAAAMVTNNSCVSTDTDGYGPNYRTRQAGYHLPQHYSSALDGNNIQTVGCGFATASALWTALTPNPHLQGSNEFWARQTEYGIAYYQAADSMYGHHWVIVTAEPRQ